jgi:integrase/recombinase XerD
MDRTKVKVVLFTSKVYADGTSPILIRMTNNRKSSYVSTGYSATLQNWDEKNNKLIEARSKISLGKIPLQNARAINNDIEFKMTEVIGAKQKLSIQEAEFSSSLLKKRLQSDVEEENGFTNYALKKIQQLEEAGQFRTYKRYKMVVDKLSYYIKKKSFVFKDLTVEFLIEYEHFLKRENYHVNTIHNHLRTIRAIINAAIREGKFSADKNPFIRFKFKSVKTNKEKLNLEELKKIEALQLDKESALWHCRNFFMFSFYNAGIRAGDFIQLKWKNVQNGRLVYSMNKTSFNKSIKLLDAALKILNYYKQNSTNSNDFIFPLLKNNLDYSNKRFLFNQISSQNAMINKNLKGIALLAGIEKPLSFHISRHSFADLARKKGASIYDISKALAHSNTKITETYLSSFDEESLDNTMDKIFQE